MKKNMQNLQVEVRLSQKCPKSAVQSRLGDFEELIKQNASSARNWKPISIPVAAESDSVTDLFDKLIIGSCQLKDGEDLSSFLTDDFSLDSSNTHVYKLNKDGALSQSIGEDDNDESIIGSQLWQLPCVEFDSIWENLIYDSNVKNEVMAYVSALVSLSEKHVNTTIINVNRLILLTGPPGTGKTSLCKGLAQHLSISMNNRYAKSVMMEINSHSLFSKWFSESGKLIQKMFDQIDELAEDDNCMVFVLIDEVESLGMCRESTSSRSEPSDAIRAVNALLTQIDRIRRRHNVLILCTSNLENTLDRALVDRADIVKNVGQPSDYARYAILKACVCELARIGKVVNDKNAMPQDISNTDASMNAQSEALFQVAKEARGLSARALSMLPTLVYANSLGNTISLDECMTLFREAVKERLTRSGQST